MAHIHRLALIAIFFIFGVFNVDPAHAVVPESNVDGWCINGQPSTGKCGASAVDACRAYLGNRYRTITMAADGKSATCVTTSITNDGRVAPAVYTSCPPNSTKENGQCSCNAGHIEQDNQCKPGKTEEEKLADYCGAKSNKTGKITTTRPAGYTGSAGDISFGCHVPQYPCIGATGCESDMFDTPKGCMHTSSMDWGGMTSDGTWEFYGTATYTGAVCTPGPWESAGNDGPPEDEETPTPGTKDPKPCEGQQGTVNGVLVCLPYDGTQGKDGSSKTNNPDGSSSETTSKTECKGNTCTTTTTTTNKDANGNSTGGSSKTDTTTKDIYCQKNPAAGACKGNGTTTGGGGSGKGDGEDDEDEEGSEWGGSCDAGWTCEGDAIQCAIAKKQHEDSCEMKKETQESKLYGQSKDKTGNVTGDLEGNETRNFSGTLNTSARFAASSCIQDLTVVVADKSVTLPLSKICPHLANIGYVLLMVAGVIAAVIVMRRS